MCGKVGTRNSGWDYRRTWDEEVDAGPPEDLDPVVVVDAEQVHQHHGDGQQHPHEAQREEELGRHEEGWTKRKPDF